MMRFLLKNVLRGVLLSAALVLGAVNSFAMHGNAEIPGVQITSGVPLELTAMGDYISTGDGNNVYFWGFAVKGLEVQYPGPTLIAKEGDTVVLRVTSRLPEATSLVIPGFSVTAAGGEPGLLTREAPPDGITAVTYTFVADRPGTFNYYSGTHSDLQVEMGLFGAIIVRPSGYLASNPTTWTAYGDERSAYDQEYLFLLSEMDLEIHQLAEKGLYDQIDTSKYWPVYWFINGRTAPDTMLEPKASWLPHQPYNCMPMLNAGQRLLLRQIGGGRDMHPFHTHGNNFDQIARDGRLLADGGGNRAAEVGVIPDKAVSDFSLTVAPGATYDAIFTWTGLRAYGHRCADARGMPERHNPGCLRSWQALAGAASRTAGADLRGLLQRQPLPRCLRQPAAGRGGKQPECRVRLHVALAQ